MDEANSIDAYTELLIHKAMNQTLKGRTAIVMAHRLSTVGNVDVIVFLEGGKIVEMGKHDEFMNYGVLYKKLYELQFVLEPENHPVSQPQGIIEIAKK